MSFGTNVSHRTSRMGKAECGRWNETKRSWEASRLKTESSKRGGRLFAVGGWRPRKKCPIPYVKIRLAGTADPPGGL